jgi:peptide deformylase
MRETLLQANGVGLAAPQVGVLRRAVLVIETNVPEGEEEYVIELINPEIIEADGEQDGAEGCLSVPDIHEDVLRPERIVMHWWDENWEEHTEEIDGLFARIAQHEIDHLDGKVFTDRLSPLRRTMLKRRMNDIVNKKVHTKYRMK